MKLDEAFRVSSAVFHLVLVRVLALVTSVVEMIAMIPSYAVAAARWPAKIRCLYVRSNGVQLV